MPELFIIGPQGDEQRLDLNREAYVLGRDPAVDITLPHPKISRRHARLYQRDGFFWVEDLGSSNGVVVAGARIAGAQRLVNGSEFELGGYRLTFAEGAEVAAGQYTFSLIGLTPPAAGLTYTLPQGDIDVGRGDECAITIADPSVSRRHAMLVVGPQSMEAEDLGSSNGSFVNGQPIGRQALADGNLLRFGNVEFEVSVEKPSGIGLSQLFAGAKGTMDGADPTLKLAAGLGFLALILMGIALFVLFDPGPSEVTAAGSPFAAYEQSLRSGLATAGAKLAQQDWDNAIIAYNDVLEQDPLNEQARNGLQKASTEKKAAQTLEKAKALLGEQKAKECLHLLRTIPNDSKAFADTHALKNMALQLHSASALQTARKECKLRQWKACHQSAVDILLFEHTSQDARSLVATAEKHLKEQGVPFTPF